MLFNSIDFALFLPVVFLLYWFVFRSNLKIQNTFLLVSSYFFYGWWDWRFLFLIMFSSAIDYWLGKAIFQAKKESRKRLWLITSLTANLGFLGVFKYYDFFAQNLVDAFVFFGNPINISRLNWVLPVGISFYTFQTMSYTIDVYREKIEPTKSVIAFFAFVSFFPQLVAGPIERASNLLPQFSEPRKFNYSKAVDGMRQILWGLFKKIVIADNLARYVNGIFENYSDYSGSTLLMGLVFFTFQIYCDFSGYSDIAIGTARLFGFELKPNFAFPLYSRNMAEFWRRWHISLTTWITDYIYTPLSFHWRKWNRWGASFALLITFLISGLWHGANWTLIIWGGIQGVLLLPVLLKIQKDNTQKQVEFKFFPPIKEIGQIGLNFAVITFTIIFFRSENLGQASGYMSGLFSGSLFKIDLLDLWSLSSGKHFILIMIMLLIFNLFEWIQRGKTHALEFNHDKVPRVVRWVIYYGIIICCFTMNGAQQQFIYFQF